MPSRFTKDDDPTEVLQFSFMDQDGHVTKSSFTAGIKPPYPIKYYVNVILIVISLVVFLLWNFGIIPGNKLGFFCNDPLFSHPYRGDTVSPILLGVGINVIFFGTYFFIENIRQSNFKAAFSAASLLEHYVYFKQFAIGLILVGGVSEIAKTIVGEHRPHFFDTCMPDTNLNCTNGTYLFDFTCTNTDVSTLDIIDASRSFPSGHSSISWFTAFLSAYIVQTRLPVHKAGTALKILLIGLCMTFGLTCSLTRITDRRHHWWDVVVGTVIGVAGAAYIIRSTHLQVKMLREKIVTEERQEVDSTV